MTSPSEEPVRLHTATVVLVAAACLLSAFIVAGAAVLLVWGVILRPFGELVGAF